MRSPTYVDCEEMERLGKFEREEINTEMKQWAMDAHIPVIYMRLYSGIVLTSQILYLNLRQIIE